jgi:hypothetical protein
MGVLSARVAGQFVPILGGAGNYLPTTGGTMTGFITLNAAPTDTLHAATKAYVDGKTYAWTTITGKPTTFPPSTHGHTWTEVSSKPTVYPPADHGHPWGDITGEPSFAANPHGDGAHSVQYALQGHGDPAHTENYSKVGHTHDYAANPHGDAAHTLNYAQVGHGNAAHAVPYMPVGGGTFTGGVTFDAFCNVSTNNFQYNQGRKDSDGAQPTLRIYASGTKYIWEHTSSLKWKREVEDASEMLLDKYHDLRPVSFLAMGGPSLEEAQPGKHTFGLIAEEVSEVLPEACSYDENGEPVYVAYDLISVVALAACQDIDKRLRALEAQ